VRQTGTIEPCLAQISDVTECRMQFVDPMSGNLDARAA